MNQEDVLYDVYFTGKLLDGISPQQAAQSVAALFKTTPDKIAHLFNGKTHILKKMLGKPEALKYKAALRKAGLSILFKVHAELSTKTAPTSASSSKETPQAANVTNGGQNQPSAANIAQPRTSDTEANHSPASLSLAPTGAHVLTEAETQDFVPANIDTRSIQLSSPFLEPEAISQPVPPAPDTSHIHIAALGTDLSESTEPSAQPLNLNLDDITLAPPGSQLEELKEDIPELNPDISGISIAPVGSDILAEKQERPPIPSPDTSHISLEE
jgi:hypothetical protein